MILLNYAIINCMKKILGNKILLIGLASLLVGFGGTYLYLSKTNKPNDNQKNVETKNDQQSSTPQMEKGNLPASQPAPAAPSVQQKAPTTNSTTLGSLTAFVTAQKNAQDGSIDIFFYIEGGGWYTLQEKNGKSWQTVQENVYYAGTGGLKEGSIPSGQVSKTVRALKLENGKYTAVSKEFTINRSEVEAQGGIKTYN